MGVRRIFVDRQPGQLIQIGLEEHVNPEMSARGLFSDGMVEVMVARIGKERTKLMVTVPAHLQVTYKSSFSTED